MKEERERKMKEFQVIEAKWVEMTLSEKTSERITNAFSDMVSAGGID